jgi:ADP-ribose pyrophosphatase YjhB (NUDIX family)
MRCDTCGSRYFANSAPTVGALCGDEQGRLLLVRRAIDPEKGKWDTPGGFLAEGEHPLDGLRRELLEETGLEIEPVEFLGAWTDSYGDALNAQTILSLNWIARVSGGTARAADDVCELRWFAPDELPIRGELAFRSVADVVEAWQARAERS